VGRTFGLQAFVFVSSPNAVTPLHMDPEHNVLIQVRGTKKLHIWDREDRQIISESDLETFHSAFTHRNLPYKEQFADAARTFELHPGKALHVPVTVPHWVDRAPGAPLSSQRSAPETRARADTSGAQQIDRYREAPHQ